MEDLPKPPIPRDSTFLVTGVNGLIASHVADQLLSAGYRVRGTVRDISHAEWLNPLFATRHGPSRLGLVQIDDASEEGAWEVALQGVSGVASVASPVALAVDDVGAAIAADLAWLYPLLGAAKRTPSVRSFAFTSSAWAAYTPRPGVPMIIREDSWNDEAVAAARDLTAEEAGLAGYMAVKVEVERACWEWVAREAPPFSFNAILPDTVLGPILAPDRQQGSTAGMLVRLYEGRDYGFVKIMAPQWFIDGRDTGRLYVAALTDTSVDRRRLFGCAQRYSWCQVLQIMRRMFPGREFVQLEDPGVDMAKMPNEVAEDMLRRQGRDGWIGLEESMIANLEPFFVQ